MRVWARCWAGQWQADGPETRARASFGAAAEEIDAQRVQGVNQMLSAGEAILLIDGLDEIADPTVRAAFCRQIEKIAEVYKAAPIIATSRIVGYREMHYRLHRGFEHGTLTDLSDEDKGAFVRRWCEVTEIRERRERAEEELITAIRSSDRIARLTGNPMLLTTLEIDEKLLSQDLDGNHPWLDPRVAINKERVKEAAKKLELSKQEVKRRYEVLNDKFGFRLAWQGRLD